MKKAISFALALLCLTAVFTGCASYHTNTGNALLAKAVYPKMASYPNENSKNFNEEYDAWKASKYAQRNQFDGYQDGLDPFFVSSIRTYLTGASDENRVYSPLNVYLALAMLAEITDGNSRAQILNLLGKSDIESLRAQAAAVWNANYCDDGAVKSILANSLWLNNDIVFNEDTVKTLAESYYASSFRGEMGSDAFNKEIQAWLNEQTGGLLKEQASNIQFDNRTILALASTIYFKAQWSHTFSKSTTTNDVFHANTGDVDCSFMYKSMVNSYYYSDHYSAVSLPLDGGGAMWFILPDENISVDSLLTEEKTFALFLGDRQEIAQKCLVVNLSIPKFDVVSDFDLADGLKTLGVTDVMSTRDSDFSPITTSTEKIALTSAKHAARVTIDEEGCTAVAYTVMMMAGACEPPKEEVDFVVDRPFLFVITGADGLPLFTGVVNRP